MKPFQSRLARRMMDFMRIGTLNIAALTLSFRQPIAGLQIFDGEGCKWVKPYGDQVLVNVGYALTALTGGYFKSGVHRIHAPPKEQIHLDRYSVLFFARYPPPSSLWNGKMLIEDIGLTAM
jgi:hypothetical protein